MYSEFIKIKKVSLKGGKKNRESTSELQDNFIQIR